MFIGFVSWLLCVELDFHKNLEYLVVALLSFLQITAYKWRADETFILHRYLFVVVILL